MPKRHIILCAAILAASSTAYGAHQSNQSHAQSGTSVAISHVSAHTAHLKRLESVPSQHERIPAPGRTVTAKAEAVNAGTVPHVPFFSQFTDVSDPEWRSAACGVVSLAMLIEHHTPGVVSVDTLLAEGIAHGAFLNGAGWIHRGLADLGTRYGLVGASHDLSGLNMERAFAQLRESLDEGPVIASVYYTFTPGHPIPHLVVINGIDGDTVYYNDPAEPTGGGAITVAKFKAAWKKRFIEARPS